MSEPTPVTTSTMTAESGSRRNDTSAEKSPTRIHVHANSTTWRSASGSPARCSTARSAKPNARITEPQARAIVPGFPSRSPINRLSSTAASGSAGMIQSIGRCTRSALEQVDLVHEHGLPQSEQVDDDREPDRHLGGGDGHHEEHEDLAIERLHVARERDEREVRGVQHELDRHEDDERVAAYEHADHADREHDRRQRDQPGERDHAPSVAARARPRAMTITPIMATSSTIEVTSNGNR